MKTAFGYLLLLLIPSAVVGRLDLLRLRQPQQQMKQQAPPRSSDVMYDIEEEAEIAFRELLASPVFNPSENSMSYGDYSSGDGGSSDWAPTPTIPATLAPVPAPTDVPTVSPTVSPTTAPVATEEPTAAPVTEAPVTPAPTLATILSPVAPTALLASGTQEAKFAGPQVDDTPQLVPNPPASESDSNIAAANAAQASLGAENGGRSGTTPGQTAMIVVLAVAAVAVAAAFVARKKYGRGMGAGRAGGSSSISEGSWLPGAVGGPQAAAGHNA